MNKQKLDVKDVVVELADTNHINKIVDMEKATWISTYPNNGAGVGVDDVKARFDPKFVKFRKSEIEKEIKSEKHKYFVAKVNSEIVGYLHLMFENGFNDLVEIYVLPNYQKSGVGARLMNKTFLEFGNDKPIRLEVASYNKNAIEIYKHYGFRVNKDLKQDKNEDWNVLPSGKRIPVIFMEKIVS